MTNFSNAQIYVPLCILNTQWQPSYNFPNIAKPAEVILQWFPLDYIKGEIFTEFLYVQNFFLHINTKFSFSRSNLYLSWENYLLGET